MSLITLLVAAPCMAGTLLPLTSEAAAVLPSLRLETVLAAHYSRNQRFPHFTPPATIESQHLVTAPELHLRIGLGEWAEIQASFAMLYLEEELAGDDDHRTFGAGDARLFTKLWLMRQRAWIPALGTRFGAKLPNADFKDRLGTDETDFEILGLASYDFGPLALHSNLGLALLGNPGPAIEGDESFRAGGQDDLFLWSVALSSRALAIAERWGLRLLAEIAGNAGSHFDNDRTALRLGPQLEWNGWLAFAGVSVGLVAGSEDFGATAGIGYRWDLPWASK